MKKLAIFITTFTMLYSATTFADDFFPSSANNSSLYYQIGGGQSVPVPPVQNNYSAPIGAEGNVGLGFSCGMFSPIDTITNSLNNFTDSVQNVPGSVVSHATTAIVSFPMYKLAQADPKLYNILNNNVIGAHNQFALNMKSCNSMQSQALEGRDPYNDWITVSRNNDMKNQMAFGDGDLNKAMSQVNQAQGNNGVPWATPGATLGSNAGGKGQPPIFVVHDTAVAGYNVMLGRNATDTSTPSKNDNNQLLLNYWGSPEEAAKWLVFVVGDQKITTCTDSDCSKNSTPGRGLLPYIQTSTTAIQKKFSDLVSNPGDISKESLLEISAPGQVVSRPVIRAITNMNENARSNTIATLSQSIAASRIVNEAIQAKTILEMGSQVPNIHSVGAAQKVIKNKINMLQQDIDSVMYTVKIRRELNSNVMSKIMSYNQQQNEDAASVSKIGQKPALIEHGGIVKQDQNA